MKVSTAGREESLAELRKWIKPNDTIYTVLRHRSASGMSREISLLKIEIEDGKPRMLSLNYHVSRIRGLRQGKHDGLVISGGGMDMGFEIVYRLGNALWPDGTPEPHGYRNGKPDRAGGYALKHQWI
jgi:hypothetical protein